MRERKIKITVDIVEAYDHDDDKGGIYPHYFKSALDEIPNFAPDENIFSPQKNLPLMKKNLDTPLNVFK